MLNIKTIIQSIYSFIISKTKKSYGTFIAMTTIAVVAILAVSITTAGGTLLEKGNDEANADELEDEDQVLLGGVNSQWETEKEYCLSLDKLTFTFDNLAYDSATKETEVKEHEEIDDMEMAELLNPGDLFEGSDGTILVANKLGIRITQEDLNCLERIVKAEAGDQGLKGMILVVNVIVNRVKSYKYANDIQGVVFQPGQFSPACKGGSYYFVKPDEKTMEAIIQALSGVDYSQEALYFCMKTSENSMFNTRLTFLFKYKDHYFYKPKK